MVEEEKRPRAQSGTAVDAVEALREALVGTMGAAATATLLRRATKRALPRSPDLQDLTITREQLDYQYTYPSAWDEQPAVSTESLRELAAQLRIILEELTGPVVVQQLRAVPELRQCDLFPGGKENDEER